MNTPDQYNAQLRQDSGAVNFSDKLTSFLYDLMRDHLPLGQVEMLVREAQEQGETRYTNGWLAQYAHNPAERLK